MTETLVREEVGVITRPAWLSFASMSPGPAPAIAAWRKGHEQSVRYRRSVRSRHHAVWLAMAHFAYNDGRPAEGVLRDSR